MRFLKRSMHSLDAGYRSMWAVSPRPGWVRGQSRPWNRPPLQNYCPIRGATQVSGEFLRTPERLGPHLGDLAPLEPPDDPSAQPAAVARSQRSKRGKLDRQCGLAAVVAFACLGSL